MDVQRQYAIDLMKQFAMKAANALSANPDQEKELAKFEIKAQIDPRVWDQIAAHVTQMLDLGARAGNLKDVIVEMKEFAARAQREFRQEADWNAKEEEKVEKAVNERREHKVSISSEARTLLRERSGP